MHDNLFNPHELEWTPEKIARFWDFESQNEAKREVYFTVRMGGALIRLVQEQQALVEPVLDYGSGGGHLVETLVGQGIQTWACDHSPASVESLNARMGRQPSFVQCVRIESLPSPLPSNAFGTVFLVETLEHLPEEWRQNTLKEIRRILRPGGFLIVTVPHNERLDDHKVICADCGAIFHRVQHMASFTPPGLSSLLSGEGFHPIYCEAVNMWKWTDEAVRHERALRTRVRRGLEHIGLLRSRAASAPHLVFIGRKG